MLRKRLPPLSVRHVMNTTSASPRLSNGPPDRRDADDVVLSWSGGKDSSLALWAMRNDGIQVAALLTTVTETFERISMHGVRVDLLRQQGASIELPLVEVRIPPSCSNETYEERMDRALSSTELRAYERYAFGDLFLEDVRAYREERLTAAGKRGVWPLWHEDTTTLARKFIDAGFRATVVTVDPAQLEPSYCGRDFDASFLADLPAAVDPCGERGEFHTFVYDGPIFRRPIDVRRGATVERDGFVFCDLMSSTMAAT
jgi:uncharacterized protein (TIGR00290 family)